jgi:ech hydrogenase subunit D
MPDAPDQNIEIIPVDSLLQRVAAFRQLGCRLVQISATRLPEQFELTYSFEHEQRLTNLRFLLPAENPRIPSISSSYWCAFLYENEMHDLFNIQVEGMAVDFHGTLYTTAVKHAFATPAVRSPAPAAPKPAVS